MHGRSEGVAEGVILAGVFHAITVIPILALNNTETNI